MNEPMLTVCNRCYVALPDSSYRKNNKKTCLSCLGVAIGRAWALKPNPNLRKVNGKDEKLCKRCNTWKSADIYEFHYAPQTRCKLSNWCRTCQIEYALAKRLADKIASGRPFTATCPRCARTLPYNLRHFAHSFISDWGVSDVCIRCTNVERKAREKAECELLRSKIFKQSPGTA